MLVFGGVVGSLGEGVPSERFGASHCRVSHGKHESELKNAQKYRSYEGMINQHYPPDKALLRPYSICWQGWHWGEVIVFFSDVG